MSSIPLPKLRTAILLGAASVLLLAFGFMVWKEHVQRLDDVLPSAATSQNQGHRLRVVWIIFDELDYGAVFDKRPSDIELPEFDRFKAQSVSLLQAEPAASSPLETAPAMLSGVFLEPANQAGVVKLPTGVSSDLALLTPHSLFARLQAQGKTSTIIGWRFPYCKLYAEFVRRCYWESSQFSNPRPSILGAMKEQAVALLPWSDRVYHKLQYERLMQAAAAEFLQDDFTLIHLPVPHGPPIYNAESDRFDFFIEREDWYFDNVKLADRSLRKLRDWMETSQDWDSTVVIVSSNYPRPAESNHDLRIPVMIKLPKQDGALTYSDQFSATSMRNLVLELVTGRVGTAEQLTEWLHSAATTSGQELLR